MDCPKVFSQTLAFAAPIRSSRGRAQAGNRAWNASDRPGVWATVAAMTTRLRPTRKLLILRGGGESELVRSHCQEEPVAWI